MQRERIFFNYVWVMFTWFNDVREKHKGIEDVYMYIACDIVVEKVVSFASNEFYL